MIGIITGREITKPRDGDKDRIVLAAEMMEDEDDVRAVELFSQAGDDVNPANGCRVFVVNVAGHKIGIAVSDDIAPESDPGEREIYSTDDPATVKKAKTKWTKDGDIIHDADGGAKIEMDHGGDLTFNEGTDNAVRYSKLEEAFNQLQDDFDNFVTTIYNVHQHATAAPGAPSNPSVTGAASTADITDAKIDDILVPAP